METPLDDEEITIPSPDSADIRNVDIRGEQSENTQREDWLLPTEPRHGARPRQTGAEQPPAMEDSVFRTLRLSPGRRIDMQEEVFTPPRGGGVRSLSLRVCKVRHSRQRKCRGSTERLVGNNITKCLRQLYGRMAGTIIQQHCNCFRTWTLNVAHLVPLARRLSRSGLVDALTAHYGSQGRLADYRRQFEQTIRTTGEFCNGLRNAGCEGVWRYGTDSPTTANSGQIYSWPQQL